MTPPSIMFQAGSGSAEMSLEEFRQFIREAVREELEHHCRIPISDEQVAEVSHTFMMIRDVGDGDVAKGVENMRLNHLWLSKLRRTGDKVGTALILLVLTAIASGLGTLAWKGLKNTINGGD